MPHKHNAAHRHHIGKMKFKVMNWAGYEAVLDMMGLDLPVPDHTTLSRRARTWQPAGRSNDRQHVADGPIHVLVDSTGLKIYGAGQWLEEKHGAKSRRGWPKLHLAIDADSGEIIAHSLTDQDGGDASQLEALLDQNNDEIDQFTADSAYDGTPTYDAVLRHSPGTKVVFRRARTQLNGKVPKHVARETTT